MAITDTFLVVFLLLIAAALPDAWLNQPYAPPVGWERVSTRCAMPVPVTRVVAGSVPPGLSITGRGEVAGTPTIPGEFAFTVEISDGCSQRLEQRQIRVMPAPMLVAEAETQEYHCPRGAAAFSGGIVRISGSAPGRAYSVEVFDGEKPGEGWLQATPRDGTVPAEGLALEADTVQLTVHPSKLAPGNYTARLRVSTWQGVNTPELVFRLRVDSPQAVLAPIVSAPSPIPVHLTITEAPGVDVITPPTVAHLPAPRFPKYQPKPKPVAKAPARSQSAVGRSRVLPFIKVILPPRKTAEKAPEPGKGAPKDAARKPAEKPSAKAEQKAETKTVAKAEPKPPASKEAPPERTKPSAMPPAAAKPGGSH